MKAKYQKTKGIYVYYVDRRGYTGPHFTTVFFQDLPSLFCKFQDWQISLLFRDFDWVYETVKEDCSNHYWYNFPISYYAAYDENFKLISRDILVHEYREWRYNRYKLRNVAHMRRRNGHKKQAWGHYRHVKTTQEIRNYFVDPEADELNVKIHMRVRNYHTLPNTWDEVHSFTCKSWKKQSKRIKQYK